MSAGGPGHVSIGSSSGTFLYLSTMDWHICRCSAVKVVVHLPAFWYADEVLDFAAPVDPDNDLCARAFEVCSKFLTPKISGPRSMDENLFRPFRYSYRTWKDGAVAFRHELIETLQHWKELGFEGPCPYPEPTPGELAIHHKEYKLFEAAQILRHDLSNLLNTASDGRVPLEDWESTESSHQEVFDGMMHAVLANENPDHDERSKTKRH